MLVACHCVVRITEFFTIQVFRTNARITRCPCISIAHSLLSQQPSDIHASHPFNGRHDCGLRSGVHLTMVLPTVVSVHGNDAFESRVDGFSKQVSTGDVISDASVEVVFCAHPGFALSIWYSVEMYGSLPCYSVSCNHGFSV